MDIPSHADLLERIDAFRERHGSMAETRFGRDALNNPAFVSWLRKGGSPTLKTLQDLSDFMARRDAELELEQRAQAARDAA